MNRDAQPPHQQGTLLAWLTGRFGRQPLNARRAAMIIVIATAVVTVAGGIAIRLADQQDFDSLGEGMWWAVQTVTTVGYGDLVPRTTAGRLIGTLVMLNGIAFISLITAAVTAMLVEQARERRQGGEEPVAAKLDQIGARLEAIEARLEGHEPGP
jgi:voltage-gated potassium channel Kch